MPGNLEQNLRQDAAGSQLWCKEEPVRMRIERQRQALSSILNSEDFLAARLPQALRILCQTAAHALNVARTSIWQWDTGRQYLECIVQWNQGKFESEGEKLETSKFPVYFEALERDGRVEAHDVRRHPAVRQLLDFYLIPLGISSMLDAGFIVDGHLAGVLCLEHVGIRRRWTPDELSFASTIAALAGLLFAQDARNSAEAEIARMQVHYHRLVNSSYDVIFTLNSEGRITFASAQWQAQLGHDIERDVLGHHFQEFLHEQDIPPTLQKWEQAMRGEPLRNHEYRVRHVDGSWRRYSANAEPIRGSDGKIESFVCSARDITEKHAEERLRAEKNRLESIARLAGGIAHEFNNMLGVILGHLDLIEEETETSVDSKEEHIEEIRAAVARSSRLTAQLLAYAQKQTKMPRLLDIHVEIENMLRELEFLCGRGIRLHWRPGAIGVLVHFDSRWLQEILKNLCLRAKDAIHSGSGRVEIRTFIERIQNTQMDAGEETLQEPMPAGDYVRIDVADDGPPIPENQLPHLFDPFSPGTGLSVDAGMRLAGVYGMVRQGGGFIFSRRDGGTTVFSIYLPVQVPETKPASASRDAGYGGSDRPLVLVVDDEPSITRMVQIILARHGIRVLTAPDPQTALDLVEKNDRHLRLLISDIAMPKMNGFSLAEAVRAQIPNIQVLYMSGYPWDSIRGNRTIPSGDGFLQKPFTPENLLEAVQSRLDSADQVR